MGISGSRRKRRSNGFAMIETMMAIAILAVGLLGVAAILAQLAGSSTTSRYMSTEVMLASEKLEDLNRLPNTDPAIFGAPVGGTLGALASDVAGFFDEVQISSENGQVLTTAGNAPATASDMLVFKRRWVVEQGPAGLPPSLKRITVLVTLQNAVAGQQSSFQTSMVRP